jgi:hypothetical protein
MIIKTKKRLVENNKIKIFELDHSTNQQTNHLLRRERMRQKLLNFRIPVYIDEDLIE